jgi:hypothetical protein
MESIRQHGIIQPLIVRPVNGKLELTTAYALAGGVQLFFLPTVYAGVTGTYASLQPESEPGQDLDVDTFTISGTVGWLPVSGLQFVGEVSYLYADLNETKDVGYGLSSSADTEGWLGRIRVQRDF